jgi:hypothetical protein
MQTSTRSVHIGIGLVALTAALALGACKSDKAEPGPEGGGGQTAQGGTGGSGGVGGALGGTGGVPTGGSGGSAGAAGAAGQGGTAADCQEQKFALTQANPEAWDFYELCVLTEKKDAETILKQIDPNIFCGVQGAWAKCEGAYETGCHGDLEYVGQTKAITDGKWAELCEMSTLDFVTKIAGGHLI